MNLSQATNKSKYYTLHLIKSGFLINKVMEFKEWIDFKSDWEILEECINQLSPSDQMKLLSLQEGWGDFLKNILNQGSERLQSLMPKTPMTYGTSAGRKALANWKNRLDTIRTTSIPLNNSLDKFHAARKEFPDISVPELDRIIQKADEMIRNSVGLSRATSIPQKDYADIIKLAGGEEYVLNPRLLQQLVRKSDSEDLQKWKDTAEQAAARAKQKQDDLAAERAARADAEKEASVIVNRDLADIGDEERAMILSKAISAMKGHPDDYFSKNFILGKNKIKSRYNEIMAALNDFLQDKDNPNRDAYSVLYSQKHKEFLLDQLYKEFKRIRERDRKADIKPAPKPKVRTR